VHLDVPSAWRCVFAFGLFFSIARWQENEGVLDLGIAQR